MCTKEGKVRRFPPEADPPLAEKIKFKDEGIKERPNHSCGWGVFGSVDPRMLLVASDGCIRQMDDLPATGIDVQVEHA